MKTARKFLIARTGAFVLAVFVGVAIAHLTACESFQEKRMSYPWALNPAITVTEIVTYDIPLDQCRASPGLVVTGCTIRSPGRITLYMRPDAGANVARHERAHRDGMNHTLYDVSGCATVTQAGGIYREGQRICGEA